MSKTNLNNNQIISLADYILDYAKVNRHTRWQDCITYESDTDHTVMMGVLGCAIASNLYSDFDIGKVAQFALVHDLVEGYAGDTNTYRIDHNNKSSKEEREAIALEKIKVNFSDMFWVYKTIKEYDSLLSKEARFIKTLDKMLPKVTTILNGGYYLIEEGETKDTFEKFLSDQLESLKTKYAYDMPELINLMSEINIKTIDVFSKSFMEKAATKRSNNN